MSVPHMLFNKISEIGKLYSYNSTVLYHVTALLFKRKMTLYFDKSRVYLVLKMVVPCKHDNAKSADVLYIP